MLSSNSHRRRNTASPAVFSIKPFKNSNGSTSFRVSGWLLGERIRRNFKLREDAIIGRDALLLKQAQTESSLRVVSTFLTDAQLREAEAGFLKLKDAPRTLSFYLDFGLTNHHEAKTNITIKDAIAAYLVERGNEVKQSLITQRQLDAINNELTIFQTFFPQGLMSELTPAKLREYILRKTDDEPPSLKTQNNRRAILFTLCKFACAQGWLATNPLADIKRHRVESSRGTAEILTAAQAAQLMAHVETLNGGAFVPYFALCLFAGIRPGHDGEISKLPASDVRLDTNAIIIEPWVSKVNMRRITMIQPNLAAWLRAYPLDQFPIMPPKDKIKNFTGRLTRLRKQFNLGHDVLRHSFISMHVAKFRSIGDTSLQAGNSEKIIRKHYLNATTPQEAESFFSILPSKKQPECPPKTPECPFAPAAPSATSAPAANAATGKELECAPLAA